jgi:hypothetical protein
VEPHTTTTPGGTTAGAVGSRDLRVGYNASFAQQLNSRVKLDLRSPSQFWNSTREYALFARDNRTMRTLFVLFVLALTTIAFEIYSDPQLTTATTARPSGNPHRVPRARRRAKRGLAGQVPLRSWTAAPVIKPSPSA